MYSASTLIKSASDEPALSWSLRFPEKIEEAYERETRKARAVSIRESIQIGLVIYISMMASQYFTMPDVFAYVVLVKVGLVLPLCLMICFLAENLKATLREALLCCCFVGFISISALLFWASDAPPAAGNFAELMLFLVFCNMLLALRYRHAVIFTGAGLSAGLIAVIAKPELGAELQLGLSVQLLGAAVFSLIANWRVETARCQSYLTIHASRKAASEAEALTSQMRGLSLTDPLTGIANRRDFEDYVNVLLAQERELGLLIIDVDFFKAYNDFYGHPAGDACLKELAGFLAHLGDLVGAKASRIGGEEFALIAPDMGEVAMRRLAARVVDGVRNLRIPHRGRRDFRDVVTVSVGLTTNGASSEAGRRSFEEMLSAADAALYQAKGRGRDRWEQTQPKDAFNPKVELKALLALQSR